MKRMLAGLIVMIMVLGFAGHAAAQDPTPKPAGVSLADAELDLVSEWTVAGGRITQIAAAPDGSLICTVTDDTLLTCTDRAGGITTHTTETNIIAVLIGLRQDVITISSVDDATSNDGRSLHVTQFVPESATGMLTVQRDGVFILPYIEQDNIYTPDHMLARLGPQGEMLALAYEGSSTVTRLNVTRLGHETFFVGEITLDSPARDIAIDADGALIALAENGQLFRSPWADGQFNVIAGDYNGDGIVDAADFLVDSTLIGGQGQRVFVVGQVETGAVPEQFVMQITPDGLEPFARWKIEEGESVQSRPHFWTFDGLVLSDGSVVLNTGAEVLAIGRDGTVSRMPLVGDDVGALVGDDVGALMRGDIGILMFADPASNGLSVVRIDASTPKLQEFRFTLR